MSAETNSPHIEGRIMYVCWRRPDGLIRPVGRLTALGPHHDDRRYRFSYLRLAKEEAAFRALPGLPDLNTEYKSDRLFPTFARRVMSPRRPDYGTYVRSLGLSEHDDPFVIMGRSGSWAPTHGWIEVFNHPDRKADGSLTTVFFVRGIRHQEEFGDAVDQVSVGEELQLDPEPQNPYNKRALLLSRRSGARVGYAPNYLLETIHDLVGLIGEDAVRFSVERLNPDSIPQLRLLCRMDAPWPIGFKPLSGKDFKALAGDPYPKIHPAPTPATAAH